MWRRPANYISRMPRARRKWEKPPGPMGPLFWGGMALYLISFALPVDPAGELYGLAAAFVVAVLTFTYIPMGLFLNLANIAAIWNIVAYANRSYGPVSLLVQ